MKTPSESSWHEHVPLAQQAAWQQLERWFTRLETDLRQRRRARKPVTDATLKRFEDLRYAVNAYHSISRYHAAMANMPVVPDVDEGEEDEDAGAGGA